MQQTCLGTRGMGVGSDKAPSEEELPSWMVWAVVATTVSSWGGMRKAWLGEDHRRKVS